MHQKRRKVIFWPRNSTEVPINSSVDSFHFPLCTRGTGAKCICKLLCAVSNTKLTGETLKHKYFSSQMVSRVEEFWGMDGL